MKSIKLLVFAGLLMSLTGVLSCHAADAEDAKWQSLFNGQDLTGWAPVHDVTFDVNDGHLRLVKGMGWLRTEKQYKDFILEFEWRAMEEQYDSGFFLRAGLEGKPWPKDGWQLNLRSSQVGWDGLVPLVHCFFPVVAGR